MFNRPILLIAFNNDQTTIRVLDGLRVLAPARLYFAVDGPRRHVAGDADRVAIVRGLQARIDWPCKVETLFPQENLGPRLAVSAAITWFFEREDAGIVLEHDCLADPSFFGFCDVMLDRYRDTDRVMHVSGNFFQPHPIGHASYYFSRIPHIWGWASWRRAWRHYDVGMRDWTAYRNSGRLATHIPWFWQRQKWRYILDRVSDSRTQTWDYQWTCALFRQLGVAVTPNVNLVTNIGFGPGAVHSTNVHSPFANLPVSPMPQALVHPAPLAVSDEADLYTCRNNFRFNPLNVVIGNVTRG